MSTAEATPTTAAVAPNIDKMATLKMLLDKIDQDENWTNRAAYLEHGITPTAMLAMVMLNTDHWDDIAKDKTWEDDPNADNDALLKYVLDTMKNLSEMVRYVHSLTLGLLFQQSRHPGTDYGKEITRVAHLMSTPCAGMAHVVQDRSKDGDPVFVLSFRRIPFLLLQDPTPAMYDDCKLQHFVQAYKMATYLSFAAAVLSDALKLHKTRYGAALAKMKPPRPIPEHVLRTYGLVEATFAPFLYEGKCHFNNHGRALMQRAEAVLGAGARYLVKNPNAEPFDAMLKIARELPGAVDDTKVDEPPAAPPNAPADNKTQE